MIKISEINNNLKQTRGTKLLLQDQISFLKSNYLIMIQDKNR